MKDEKKTPQKKSRTRKGTEEVGQSTEVRVIENKESEIRWVVSGSYRRRVRRS